MTFSSNKNVMQDFFQRSTIRISIHHIVHSNIIEEINHESNAILCNAILLIFSKRNQLN